MNTMIHFERMPVSEHSKLLSLWRSSMYNEMKKMLKQYEVLEGCDSTCTNYTLDMHMHFWIKQGDIKDG